MNDQEVPGFSGSQRDKLMANVRSVVRDRISGGGVAPGTPMPRQTTRAFETQPQGDPSEFARYLNPQTRGFSQEDLSRFKTVNHAIYSDPLGFAQRVSSSHKSLPHHHRVQTEGEYRKILDAANDMAMLKSLAEIGDLPAFSSGLANQIGNVGGMLPKWGQAVERWFDLTSKWKFQGVDPETGQLVQGLGEELGDLTVSEIMSYAAEAVGRLDQWGVGDAVSPQLRDLIKEHFAGQQVSGTLRTVAEFMAVKGGAGKLASKLAGATGVAGRTAGAAARLVAGSGGGSELAHMAALGAAHGGLASGLGAALGGGYDEYLQKEMETASLEEIAEYGGDYEVWAKKKGEALWPRMSYIMGQTFKGGTHGAVSMLGWSLGMGAYKAGVKRLALGKEATAAQKAMLDASGKAMKGLRPKIKKALDKLPERSRGTRMLAQAMYEGPSWLFGAKGAELATQMAFGHPEPSYVELLANDPLITVMMGGLLGAFGAKDIRGWKLEPGERPTPQASVERLMRSQPRYFREALEEARARGITDKDVMDTVEAFRSNNVDLVKDFIDFWKSGLSKDQFERIRRETREELTQRLDTKQLPEGRGLAEPEVPPENRPAPEMSPEEVARSRSKIEEDLRSDVEAADGEANVRAREAGFESAQELRAWQEELPSRLPQIEVQEGTKIPTLERMREALDVVERIPFPETKEQAAELRAAREALERGLSERGELDVFAEESRAARSEAAQAEMRQELNALRRDFALGGAEEAKLEKARVLERWLREAQEKGAEWEPPEGYPRGPYRTKRVRQLPEARQPAATEAERVPAREADDVPITPAAEAGEGAGASLEGRARQVAEVNRSSPDYEYFRDSMNSLAEEYGKAEMAEVVGRLRAEGVFDDPKSKAWATRFSRSHAKKNG